MSYSFQYDRLNRLLQKSDSRGRSMSFTYDRVGNLLTKTTYQGSTTSYVYNAANRRVMLRNPDYTQIDYQYDPAGRLLSRVTASGARTRYQYDANGGLTNLTQYDAADALVSDTTYTRDRVGNLLTAVDAGGTTTYVYDALYRLKTADYPGTANDELFSYDNTSNRTQYTKGSLVANATTRYYTYTTGTNRLANIRIGSTAGTLESSFTHDFEGRLTAQTGTGAKTVTWDAKGRVKTVGSELYSYDPLDYRIGRSGGSLGSRDYFLEGEHLESVYQGGVLKEKYFRGSGIDELVAGFLTDTDAKLKPFLFHHDQVNSVSAVSGHDGGTLQTIKYQAFGGAQSGTGSSPSRLKYTGREDDGTGLYYYRARYYDPSIGRFISEDPLGFAAGINFYAYVGNNPVNNNDPNGLCPSCIGAGTSVLLGGGIRYFTSGGDWNAVFDPTAIATDAALGAVGAGLVNKASQLIQLRHVPSTVASLGTRLTASGSNTVNEGVYLINSSAGRYVGQSGGMGTRLATHAANTGRFGDDAAASANNAVRLSVQGGTTSREVAEQRILFGMGGKNADDVLNRVNPIGGRLGLLDNTRLGIADSIFVPNISTGTAAASGTFPSLFGFSNNASGSAGGGFLLYPNKANLNMMQSVYAK